jgi:hypothetical protein
MRFDHDDMPTSPWSAQNSKLEFDKTALIDGLHAFTTTQNVLKDGACLTLRRLGHASQRRYAHYANDDAWSYFGTGDVDVFSHDFER